MSEDQRLHFPATQRNLEPIIAVLNGVIPSHGTALEIGSGSGEHACAFATHFAEIDWIPSDPDPAHRASIDAWASHLAVDNIRSALDLDVSVPKWNLDEPIDAVLSINMIHIAPWAACTGLFGGAAQMLRPDGLLFLYGPYMLDGQHTAPSNAAFHDSLLSRDPAWGIRDLAEVIKTAQACDFFYVDKVAMPANNFSVIFRRTDFR